MPEKSSQNYLRGAAILAATVAVTKIFGAVYKIALGNIIGDEGFAHFTVAYNIYNLLLTLSTAGLPIAVSKMVSEANALGRRRQISRIFAVACASFCVLGFIGSAVMLLFPRELAIGFNDVEAEKSILALCPSIFLVCLMSAYRGYTQGHSDMKLTSVSQIIEVLGKVIFGLALAVMLLGDGLPSASAGAIAGVSIGSLFACVYSAVYIKRMRKRRTRPVPMPDNPDGAGEIFRRLVAIAIPVAFGTSVLNFINLIDTKLIMSLLQNQAGFTYSEAKVLFGVYGKVQTLFNTPSAFILPLAISIIPAISASAARKMNKDAADAMRTSIKITTLLGLPAGVGLSVLAGPIMTAVFSGSAPEGAGLLTILGISSYFGCLTLITNAILQAYGHEKMTIVTVAIGGALKIALDIALVGNPDFGIYGAAVGTFVCYAAISGLNLILIKKALPSAPGYMKIIFKPVICSAVMGAAAYFSYPVFYRIAGAVLGNVRVWIIAAVSMSAAIILAVILYFAAVAVTKTLTKEEVFLMPGGKKLARILKIR